VKVWIGCIWPRMGPVAGSCEHSNEPSCSIKAENFLAIQVNVRFSRRTLLHGIS
jgi:hypothetical protein